MNKIKSRICYDPKFDVLYCSIGDTSNSYGDEIGDRVVLLRDMDTNNITGITIFDHLKMINEEKGNQ